MPKKFKKKKATETATTPEQKALEHQRMLQARTLRNRRRRKSHQ